MSEAQRVAPDLQVLATLFYPSPEELGEFEKVAASGLPPDYQTLLVHEKHMTVTVEAFHGDPVNVDVLKTHTTPTHYARKILLTRQSDGLVVQFGIARLNWAYVDDAVRREIERQQKPLGRILIDHNVLRKVEFVGLWRVVPGADLQRLFGLYGPEPTYGRTALIYCNGEPAVELLEIVTPL